jgi:hypothetical protein
VFLFRFGKLLFCERGAKRKREKLNYRLTAEGKLGEAGQKLEQLKRKLEELNARQK